jgi:adenosylcobinamide-phosphate synthase
MAGALGVRLGGRNIYFGRSEVRPFLGDGPRPEARHLNRAARISGAVGLGALALASRRPGRGRGAAGLRRPWAAWAGRGGWGGR